MKINYVKGDLFKNLPKDRKVIICHCVNDVGAWGKGFVVALNNYSDTPKKSYLGWINGDNANDYTQFRSTVNTKPKLGECQVVKCSENVYVANMFGQSNIYPKNGIPPIRYWALSRAMRYVKRFYEVDIHHEIHCPFFGSGLAGGNKDFIETLINEIWVNEGIPTTIYEL